MWQRSLELEVLLLKKAKGPSLRFDSPCLTLNAHETQWRLRTWREAGGARPWVAEDPTKTAATPGLRT